MAGPEKATQPKSAAECTGLYLEGIGGWRPIETEGDWDYFLTQVEPTRINFIDCYQRYPSETIPDPKKQLASAELAGIHETFRSIAYHAWGGDFFHRLSDPDRKDKLLELHGATDPYRPESAAACLVIGVVVALIGTRLGRWGRLLVAGGGLFAVGPSLYSYWDHKRWAEKQVDQLILEFGAQSNRS
jgi:hypothetical protein